MAIINKPSSFFEDHPTEFYAPLLFEEIGLAFGDVAVFETH